MITIRGMFRALKNKLVWIIDADLSVCWILVKKLARGAYSLFAQVWAKHFKRIMALSVLALVSFIGYQLYDEYMPEPFEYWADKCFESVGNSYSCGMNALTILRGASWTELPPVPQSEQELEDFVIEHEFRTEPSGIEDLMTEEEREVMYRKRYRDNYLSSLSK